MPSPTDGYEHRTAAIAAHPIDELLEECVSAWTRALRTYREFPAAHPHRDGAREGLSRLIGGFLAGHGSLTLDVGEDGLFHGGDHVGVPGRSDAALAHLLHRGGIRRLVLHPTPEHGELDDILDAMAREADPAGPHDLIGALWERDLPHVEIITAAPEELIPAVRPPRLGGGAWPVCGVRPQPPSRATVPGLKDSIEDMDDWSAAYALWTPPLAVPEVDPFERVKLRMELEDEVRADSIVVRGKRASDLILAEADLPSLTESVAAVGHALSDVLDRGCLDQAFALLAGAQQALHQHPLAFGMRALERAALWSMLLDAEAVGRGVLAWEKRNDHEMTELLMLIDEMEEHSSDALCQVLLHSGIVKARRHACQRLIQVCATAPERLRPWMDRPEWFLARNLAYVFANIPGVEAEGMLLELVRHQDARVRLECVAGLGGCRSAATRDSLVALVDDPDSALRLAALRGLRELRDPMLAAKLAERMKIRAFSGFPPEERAAVLETLGCVGGPDHIPALEGQLFAPSPFDRRDSDPVVDAAARALVKIGDPAAQKVLRRALKSWSRPVRRAAERVLDQPEVAESQQETA